MLNTTRRKPPNDQRRRLEPKVPTHRRNHGNKDHHGHDLLNREPEPPQDESRHKASGQIGKQPGKPQARGQKTGGAHLGVFFGGSGHLQHILGVFISNDVHHVVYRNNPHEPMFGIDNRDRQEVVVCHLTGDFFLCGLHAHTDDVAEKQAFQGRRWSHHQ